MTKRRALVEGLFTQFYVSRSHLILDEDAQHSIFKKTQDNIGELIR